MNSGSDILVDAFLAAAGGGWSGVAVADVMWLLKEVQTGLAEAQVTRSTSSGGSTPGGSSGIGSTLLKSTFGLAPLAGAIISLFSGGGDKEEPAPLVEFALPSSLQFEAANTKGGVAGMDYGQEGLPRMAATEDATAASAPAVDRQWFLDHSAEIAGAVREAMLNMSALNDVVIDL